MTSLTNSGRFQTLLHGGNFVEKRGKRASDFVVVHSNLLSEWLVQIWLTCLPRKQTLSKTLPNEIDAIYTPRGTRYHRTPGALDLAVIIILVTEFTYS